MEKRSETLRIRVEKELKVRLAKLADAAKKKPSEYLREKLWQVAEQTASSKRSSA